MNERDAASTALSGSAWPSGANAAPATAAEAPASARAGRLPRRFPRAAARLVAWARAHVPLYRDLYADAPVVDGWRGFRQLPVLTAARLRDTPLLEQVDNLNDSFRTFSPYQPAGYLPATMIVADRADTGIAFDACLAAFRLAGVQRGTRLVLLTAPEQRYVAAELAERLGYDDVYAHVVVALEPGGVERALAALAPEQIATVGITEPAGIRPQITTRNHCSPASDLYLTPEAGIIAVRPRGAAGYRVVSPYFMIEAERDGRLLLTALHRYHQPLIRFELAERGRIRDGRLWPEEFEQ